MEIFTLDNIRTDIAVSSKEEALANVAAFAVERGYATDADGVLTGLKAREDQMSTALMDGIAIPHAKHEAITEAALLVLRFTNPVDWTDTDIVSAVAMLVPEAEAGSTHLQLLAKVSRALMDEDLRATINNGAPEDIHAALGAKLG